MRKSLYPWLLSLLPLAGSAEVITESQAFDLASRFFNGEQSVFARVKQEPLQLTWKSTLRFGSSSQTAAPTFYVYNRGENQGFVIISGDNAVAPVLAYAREGHFSPDCLPAPLQDWCWQVNERISAVRELQQEPSAEIEYQWEQLTVGQPVVELKTAEWDQREPYNAYLPAIGDWHGYAGCTITASAIVMAYHQWPDSGVGQLKGYHTNGLGVDVPGITLGHPYRWDQMPGINGNVLNTDTDSPEYRVQEDAVSTLIRDLGVMYKARYDYDATSADIEVVPLKLVRHMKYHEGAMHLKEEHFSEAVWQRILREELDEKRPILFAGYKANGSEGHSIVLDGYDNLGCFHVNWGWSGRYNGYYNLESMYAGSEGTDIIPGGYSQKQEAVLRLQPDRSDTPVSLQEKMIFTLKPLGGSSAPMGLHVVEENQEFTKGATFTVSAGAYMNFSSVRFTGHMQLAVTDAVGKIKKVLYTTPGERDLMPGSAMMPLDEARDFVTVTLEDPVAPGDRIRLLFPAQDGSWKPVTCEEPDGQWEIVLKENDETTDIESVETDDSYKVYYDLSGRRVIQPTQGVFIRNGHKVVIQ